MNWLNYDGVIRCMNLLLPVSLSAFTTNWAFAQTTETQPDRKSGTVELSLSKHSGSIYSPETGLSVDAPTISIDDVSADEGAGTLTFTISLSAVSDVDISVDFVTADGTARAPLDYIPASGTLTIPAGEGQVTITFGNIGDFGSAGSGEESVANMLLAMNPDFITTNGDNNYPDGKESTWAENVLQYYGSYVDAVDANANRFYATLGNHDYHTFPSAFLNGLALPEGQGNERYYDFVKGPIHFFALDSNSEQPDGRSSTSIQAQWLQARLAESTSVWNIVYFHHAPWSSGSHHGNASEMQWPFDAWGVDAVFAGHEHVYERILKDEDGDGEPILYFVNGLGGSSPYDFDSPIEGSEVRYSNDLGAMFIRANNASIVYEFHSVSEGLVDQYVVTNTAGKSPASQTAISAELVDDAEIEDAETFTVILSNPVNATLADAQGTGTIADNDAPLPVTASFQDGLNGYSRARDTRLESGSPGANYGNSNTLKVDGSPSQSALLYWDISSIPAEKIIDSVELTINVSNGSGDRYELYEMLRPWVEGEATWEEFASGQSWQVAGASGPEDRGFDVLGVFKDLRDGLNTVALDSTGVALVQSWVNDSAGNHGFILKNYTDASDGMDFSSREHATAAQRPKLTVVYHDEPVQTTDTTSEPSRQFYLSQNYPNPFNSTTRISFSMSRPGFVALKVYDLLGKEVQSLFSGFKDAGVHAFDFNAGDLSSGIYLYTLRSENDFVVTKKMLFLK